MVVASPVAAFILSGGASSRMGCDKALLPVSGVPLLLRAMRLLQPLVAELTIVGKPDVHSRFGLPVVPDDRPGIGPLGGIATALRISTAPWNLIVGCDLPYLVAPFLESLIRRALASAADALLPESARGPEPLCAMYNRRCLPSIEGALDRGEFKVTRALSHCGVEMLPEAEWKQFDSGGRLFKNMNSPADYEEARAFLERVSPR